MHAGTFKLMPFTEADDAVTDELLNLNVKSIIYGIKYTMIAMKEKGTKGAILINSSAMSHVAKSNMQGAGLYSATKSAADMLVQYAAIEGAESGALLIYHP
jgi:NAD(P)-dependent dehydrogenase (short-subunit alcohol dehydrogenase family)